MDLGGDGMQRRRARVAFIVFAVATFVLIVGLGLGMTFFADEWAFIESRSLTDPSTWWAPHNEHWSTLAILLYRAIVESMGIGSYVPYLAVVAMLHVAVATLVYRLLERSSGPLIALAGGTIALVFGSGFENLYWGFQVGFVGSMFFGLLALDVMDGGVDGRRAVSVAALLLASIATSGVGLAVCLAVGLEWLLDPRWRRWVPLLVLPASAYLAWYTLAGRYGVALPRDTWTVARFLTLSPSVMRGLANAFGSVTGLPALGLLVAAIVATWGSRAAARREVAPRAVALIAAIATLYGLIGATRDHLFDGALDYTRYTYVSGLLAMVALGTLIGPVRLPEAGRHRLAALGLIGGWVAVALVVNIGLLIDGRAIFLDRADMTRALATVALDPSRPASVDLGRSLVLVPSPTTLERIRRTYGDPRTDSLVPWAVRPIPLDVLAEAQRRLIEGAPIFQAQP